MLHHPTGVARGQASDVHNEGRELLRTRDYMDATLSVATGRPFASIQNDLERALYMSPQVRCMLAIWAAGVRALFCLCPCLWTLCCGTMAAVTHLRPLKRGLRIHLMHVVDR